MQQGDQYAIPITVTIADGTLVTPDTCEDIKIKIGNLTEKTYGAGELTPETEDGEYTGRWLYPLTQADTLTLGVKTPIQAQVKFADGTIHGTPVSRFTFNESIILTEWGDGNAD